MFAWRKHLLNVLEYRNQSEKKNNISCTQNQQIQQKTEKKREDTTSEKRNKQVCLYEAPVHDPRRGMLGQNK